MADAGPSWALRQDPLKKGLPGTAKKMARPSPRVPCSVLSLLFLLLSVPLSRSRSILYPASAWGLYHLYYPNPAGVQDYGDPQARQNSNQDEDVLQYCDGAFDIYYLMDS